MIRNILASLVLALTTVTVRAAEEPADLIVHHGKVLTVDAKFSTAQAGAVQDGRIVAAGDNEAILKGKGPKTRVTEAGGHTVLPGLYDSPVPSVGAAVSELREPLPRLKSIKDVTAHI